MELCSLRYSIQVVPGRSRFFEVDGLGLPFERLYFEARKQLFRARNALTHLQAEQECEREELLLDEFDLIDAYKSRRRRRLLGCGIYSTLSRQGGNQALLSADVAALWPHNISMVADNYEELAHTGRSRSI
jgi:hypothetical protein